MAVPPVLSLSHHLAKCHYLRKTHLGRGGVERARNEHCIAGVIDGQFQVIPGKMGNADALAQFEYRFDYGDHDTSEGAGQGWKGKIPNPPADGTDAGLTGHAKALAAAKWLESNHQLTSYMVFAHIERQGVFNKYKGGNNTGYNIEHCRDFNNAAPHVCFGFEGQPGHQAESGRGGFSSTAAGQGTYGGTGYYAAKIGGWWDALLSEGRNWWLFASSDFHSRRVPEYDDANNPAADPNKPTPNNPLQNSNTINSGWRGSTATKADFWPGEYQKDYVLVKSQNKPTPQDVLNGMRSGNSYIVQGDLIRGLDFTARAAGPAANMGEILTVDPTSG